MASLSERIEQFDNLADARQHFGIHAHEDEEEVQIVDWNNPCALLEPGDFRNLCLQTNDLCPSVFLDCDWRAVLREQRFAHPSLDCQVCGASFGWVINKRYHCRGCGRALCYSCAADFVWIPSQYAHLRRYKDYVTGARMCAACLASAARASATEHLCEKLKDEAPRLPTICRLAMLNAEWRDAAAFYLSEMRLLQQRLPGAPLLTHERNFLENNKLFLRSHAAWLPSLAQLGSYLGTASHWSVTTHQEDDSQYPEGVLRAPTVGCNAALCLLHCRHDQQLANSIAYFDRYEETGLISEVILPEAAHTRKHDATDGDTEGIPSYDNRDSPSVDTVTKDPIECDDALCADRAVESNNTALICATEDARTRVFNAVSDVLDEKERPGECHVSPVKNIVRLLAVNDATQHVSRLLRCISPYNSVSSALVVVALRQYNTSFAKPLLQLAVKNVNVAHVIFWHCASRPLDLALLQLKNELMAKAAPRVNEILSCIDILESEYSPLVVPTDALSRSFLQTSSEIWHVEGTQLPLVVCPLQPIYGVVSAAVASDCAALIEYTTSSDRTSPGRVRRMEFVRVDLEEYQRTAALLDILHDTVGARGTSLALMRVRPCMYGCGFVETASQKEKVSEILEITSLEQYISAGNITTPFADVVKTYLDSLAFCAVIGLLCGRDCTKDTILIRDKQVAVFDAPPLLDLVPRRRVCVQAALLEFGQPLTNTTTATYFVSLCCDLLLRVRREYVLLHSLAHALDFGDSTRELAAVLSSLLLLGESEASVAASFSRLIKIV